MTGPAVKSTSSIPTKGSGQAVPLDFTYFNAVRTVENALSKVKDEKGMKRIEKFLTKGPCPACLGTRSMNEHCRQTHGQKHRRSLRDDALRTGCLGEEDTRTNAL